MVPPPTPVKDLCGLLIIFNVWIWGLSGVVLNIRLNNTPRPLPPHYESFPYGVLRIGIDPSFPPFAADINGNLVGFDVDLAYLLGEELDIEVQLITVGFDGLYDAILADQVDAVIASLIIDHSRFNVIRYTIPYFNNGLVLVSPVNDQALKRMADLPGHTLAFEYGSEADSFAHDWLRRVDDFELRPYEIADHALDAVIINEADAALVEMITYYLYTNPMHLTQTQFTYATHVPYAIAVRSDRIGAWESLNRALKRLQNTGTVQTLIDKWFIAPGGN